jgi:hypothetical protein
MNEGKGYELAKLWFIFLEIVQKLTHCEQMVKLMDVLEGCWCCCFVWPCNFCYLIAGRGAYIKCLLCMCIKLCTELMSLNVRNFLLRYLKTSDYPGK